MSFDTTKARCRVSIYKDGLLSSVGHDLLLEVKSFRLTIKDDLSIEAECRADSVEVIGAVKNGAVDTKAISARDLRGIKEDIDHKILDTRRHPSATFRSTAVTESAGGYRVTGVLNLHGIEQSVQVTAEKRATEVVAKLTVHQPSFGITPYRAMLGALKIKPDVLIEVSVPISP